MPPIVLHKFYDAEWKEVVLEPGTQYTVISGTVERDITFEETFTFSWEVKAI